MPFLSLRFIPSVLVPARGKRPSTRSCTPLRGIQLGLQTAGDCLKGSSPPSRLTLALVLYLVFTHMMIQTGVSDKLRSNWQAEANAPQTSQPHCAHCQYAIRRAGSILHQTLASIRDWFIVEAGRRRLSKESRQTPYCLALNGRTPLSDRDMTLVHGAESLFPSSLSSRRLLR